MTYEELVLSIDSLPPLSNSAQKIIAMFDQDDNDLNLLKLTKFIENDSILTANLLKMINDPKFGFANKIRSISQAITLLGVRVIKGFVISFSVNEVLKADMSSYGLSTKAFNEVSQIQTALLLQWYMKVDIKRAQILVPLVLIMECGKVLFSSLISRSEYKLQFQSDIENCVLIDDVEINFSDTSSYYISGLLFEHWNFPKVYIDLMKNMDFEEDPESVEQLDLDILDIIRTAVNVKDVLSLKNLEQVKMLLKKSNMDEDKFMNVALRMRKDFHS